MSKVWASDLLVIYHAKHPPLMLLKTLGYFKNVRKCDKKDSLVKPLLASSSTHRYNPPRSHSAFSSPLQRDTVLNSNYARCFISKSTAVISIFLVFFVSKPLWNIYFNSFRTLAGFLNAWTHSSTRLVCPRVDCHECCGSCTFCSISKKILIIGR